VKKIFFLSLIILLGCVSQNQNTKKIKTEDKKEKNVVCEPFFIKDKIVYYNETPFVQSDWESFECLKDEYAKDKNGVYFSEKYIKETDPKTFQILNHGYSKDKNFVYYDFYSGKKIENANSESFEVFDLSITKDKNNVYYFKDLKEIVILKADSKTFKQVCDYFYEDKDNIYGSTGEILKKINDINNESFEDFKKELCRK